MYWCIELIKSLVLQACQHPNKHPPLPSDWHSCLHCGPGRCLSAVLCDHQPHPSDPDCPWQAPGGSTKSFLSDRSSQFVTSLTFAQQEQMITSQRSTAEAQHCIAFQGGQQLHFLCHYTAHMPAGCCSCWGSLQMLVTGLVGLHVAFSRSAACICGCAFSCTNSAMSVLDPHMQKVCLIPSISRLKCTGQHRP